MEKYKKKTNGNKKKEHQNLLKEERAENNKSKGKFENCERKTKRKNKQTRKGKPKNLIEYFPIQLCRKLVLAKKLL